MFVALERLDNLRTRITRRLRLLIYESSKMYPVYYIILSEELRHYRDKHIVMWVMLTHWLKLADGEPEAQAVWLIMPGNVSAFIVFPFRNLFILHTSIKPTRLSTETSYSVAHHISLPPPAMPPTLPLWPRLLFGVIEPILL